MNYLNTKKKINAVHTVLADVRLQFDERSIEDSDGSILLATMNWETGANPYDLNSADNGSDGGRDAVKMVFLDQAHMKKLQATKRIIGLSLALRSVDHYIFKPG